MNKSLMYIDIEVLQKYREFPDPDKAERPIICITVYSNFSNKYFTIVWRDDFDDSSFEKMDSNWFVIKTNNEKKMLEYFFTIFRYLDPDIITGWNILFDLKYIINRSKNIGLDPSKLSDIRRVEVKEDEVYIGGRHVIDMLKAYKKIKKQPSYSLKFIAVAEGLTEKTEDTEEIPYLYKNNIERLLIYNKTDVQILVELENKLQILKQFIEMTRYVGANYITTPFNFSTLLDILALRFAKNKNVVLPNKQKSSHITYEGAIVFYPPKGLYKNVIVLDMNRYYPNIILTLNEILDNEKIKLASEMVKYLFRQRDKYENEMEKYEPGSKEYKNLAMKRQVVKDLVNAIYGFLGYSKSRLFELEIAKKITEIARKGLLFVSNIIKKEGYKVIYGDTDSIFVKLPDNLSLDDCINIGYELEQKINTKLPKFSMSLGSKKNYFTIGFEKVCSPILFVGVKKRYASRIVFEKNKKVDYIDVKGFDSVRSDTPEFLSDVQMKLFEMILYDKKEVIPYLRDIYQKIQRCEYTYEELGVPKSLQKDVVEYESPIPFHVRACIYSMRHLGMKFSKGSKFRVLFVKNIKGYPKTDVLAFYEEKDLKDLDIEIDKNKYVEWLEKKCEKILNAVGIRFNEIKREKRTLFSF